MTSLSLIQPAAEFLVLGLRRVGILKATWTWTDLILATEAASLLQLNQRQTRVSDSQSSAQTPPSKDNDRGQRPESVVHSQVELAEQRK